MPVLVVSRGKDVMTLARRGTIEDDDCAQKKER
jgi:hypothetical protein